MFIRISSALAASRAKRAENDKGFTLIELLVVVLIIGVLSAIAIPIFIGQQNSAKDAAAKADLANAKTAVIAYAADHSGTFSAVAADLKPYGYVNAPPVATVVSGTAFCISELSGAGSSFAISDLTNAPAKGTCSTAAVFVAAT